MQKLQPLKTLLLLLSVTLLAAFLAACSTDSSSTTPFTPDAPDVPGPVAGEAAFMLNLEKLVIDRAQVTAHFTNALLKADLGNKGNYSGTASISSITTGGEFTTNGNTYASNVTLTLSGELEAHSLALAGEITAYSTVYSNLRSSNVVDLAGFNRIPLPSSSSNYVTSLYFLLNSKEFAGRTVSLAHAEGDIALTNLRFSPYQGGVAYVLIDKSSAINPAIDNLTRQVSLGIQISKNGNLVRQERKLYSVKNADVADKSKTVFFDVAAGEDITLVFPFKLISSESGTYEESSFGEYYVNSVRKILISFAKTKIFTADNDLSESSASKLVDFFTSLEAEKPQNGNPGNDANFIYRNVFTLKDRRATPPNLDLVNHPLVFAVYPGGRIGYKVIKLGFRAK